LPAREFRGVWVASVHNIDWPSKPGLTTAEQQAELLAMLDRAQRLKLNVFVFQVRPACDALYASTLEPWSEYLNGTMGKAPSPFWDPLTFAVAEAHKRGLELHAWFNPFRARHSTGFSAIARTHVSKTRPSLVKPYGPHLWLDPGLPEVHDYSMRVLLDVVKRYDIDGIHIDDYFYPYREKDASGKLIPFPDWTSWNNFLKAGGKLDKEDWRRENVNRFVARMYREVKAAKPWVKVGISPFGIYRPGFPEQIKGFDQFASLYADPRLWLSSGWLDYLAPQLYWPIEPPAQSFPVLLKWWTENNPRHLMIVPGLNTTAVGSGKGWPATEITRQIQAQRQQPGASGHIHWNMHALMANKGDIAEELARTVYTRPALPPALPASGEDRLVAPRTAAKSNSSNTRVTWSVPQDNSVAFWLVQSKTGEGWTSELLPSRTTTATVPGAPAAISVRSVTHYGQLAPPAVLEKASETK